MSSSSREENIVVLNYHNTLLHKSDVDLIDGPYWLNDKIISFYFEYLEKDLFPNEKLLLFIPPEVTQCLKMVSPSEVNIFLDPLNASSKKFIFLAVNNNETAKAGGSHWSLLVYSRPERKFFHLDSLPTQTNLEHGWTLATHILHYLTGITNGDCDLVNLETLPQTNSYDCGVHLLCNTDLVVDHVLRHGRIAGCDVASSVAVRNKRRELLHIIYSRV